MVWFELRIGGAKFPFDAICDSGNLAAILNEQTPITLNSLVSGTLKMHALIKSNKKLFESLVNLLQNKVKN